MKSQLLIIAAVATLFLLTGCETSQTTERVIDAPVGKTTVFA